MVARKPAAAKATAAAAAKATEKADPRPPSTPYKRVRPRVFLVQLESVADDGGDHVVDMKPVQFSIPARELSDWVENKLPAEITLLEKQLNGEVTDA